MAPAKSKATDAPKAKTSKTPVTKSETGAGAKKAGNNKQSEEPSEPTDKDPPTEVVSPLICLMPVICEPCPPTLSPRHPENNKDPQLHRAIVGHRMVHARYLIEKCGMSVNKMNEFRMTPMLLTCLMDDESYALSMASLLYRNGADVNACDMQGRRPLHHCCLQGHICLATWLLKIEVIDFASWDCFGYTALMYACIRGGDPCFVKTLVARYIHSGINVDAYRRGGFTAMMLACRCGNYASAYVLLTCGGAQATMRDDEEFKNATEWVQMSTIQGNSLEMELCIRPHDKCAERCIDGKDSLCVLLQELKRAEERMSVRGDQGDSDQQAACLPCASYPPPSTPRLLSLGLMPATGMRPDLPSILSLYIHDDWPIYDCSCCEDDSTDAPAEEAPVVPPTVTAPTSKASKAKGKSK